MIEVDLRAFAASIEEALQLMDIEKNLRDRILLKKASRIEVETIFSKKLNSEFYGYFPNGRNKNQLVNSEFGSSAVEGLAFLCFDIVSSHGYNQYKQKSASDLKLILGNKYNQILEVAEKNSLLKIQKTKTAYHSDKRSCFHSEIAVIGRSGSFKRKKLHNEQTIKRIRKYRKIKMNHSAELALNKTYQNQQLLFICDDRFKTQNLGLEFGFFIPTIDTFGRRLHSFITNLNKEHRPELRHILNPEERLVEVDLKSSHPYLLMRLISNYSCLEYAFDDQQILEQFLTILDTYENNCELMHDMERSIDNGSFYSDFFNCLLDDSIEDWEGFILEKHLKKNPEVKVSELTKLDLCKLAFMYVVNGGAKPILDALQENEYYRNFISLVLVLQNTWIPKNSSEIKGFKKPYFPKKNLSIILQRIESKAMQTAFNSLNDIWGLLLHDSIVCMDKDKEAVKQAIKNAYRSLDLGIPIVAFKN